jgi:uncharacterized C2H2 Zn-finger protein
MVSYTCNKCESVFDHKGHYDRHINRKSSCVTQCIEITLKSTQMHTNDTCKNSECIDKTSKSCTQKDLSCTYCNVIFTRKSSLLRHMNNYCKVKKTNNSKMEELYQGLLIQMKLQNEELKEIKRQNEELRIQNNKIMKLEKEVSKSRTIDKSITNSNSNNNNQNIQNNIKLVAFGKEDMSNITDNVLKKIFSYGHNSLPKLIEHVHFNENQLENANIYISNIKDPYVMVFNGRKWDLKLKDGPITDLLENNMLFLEDNFYNLIDELEPRTRKRFERFLDIHEEDETKNKLKKEIKILLYNHKDIPMKMIKVNNKFDIYTK